MLSPRLINLPSTSTKTAAFADSLKIPIFYLLYFCLWGKIPMFYHPTLPGMGFSRDLMQRVLQGLGLNTDSSCRVSPPVPQLAGDWVKSCTL